MNLVFSSQFQCFRVRPALSPYNDNALQLYTPCKPTTIDLINQTTFISVRYIATEHVDTWNMLTSTAVDVDIHPHFQFVKLFYGFGSFHFDTDGTEMG